MSESEAPLQLTLNVDGQEITFSSWGEFGAWAGNEAEIWSDFFDRLKNTLPNLKGEIRNYIVGSFDNLRSHAKVLENDNTASDAGNRIKNATSILGQIAAGELPCSESVYGQTLLTLADQDQREAAIGLAVIFTDGVRTRFHNPNEVYVAVRAVAKAILKFYDSKILSQSLEQALEATRARWDITFATQINSAKEANAQIEAILSAARDGISEFNDHRKQAFDTNNK